jgi:NDP-sugar pyrophosphorylase family protein
MSVGQYNIIDDDVIIEDGASVGNFNVIASGTIIRKGAVVGNYCEIGKNNDIGENSIVQGRIRTAANCVIEKNVTLKYGTPIMSIYPMHEMELDIEMHEIATRQEWQEIQNVFPSTFIGRYHSRKHTRSK